jgi:hypothetical protein
MKALARRIARWFGLDGNPLRRRTDKIESAWRILLIVAFCVGAPVMAAAIGNSVRGSSRAEVSQQASWHQVSATLLTAAPPPTYAYGSMATFWAKARWQTPGGAITGRVPVPAGAVRGTVVPIWVDGAGRPTGRAPLTSSVVIFRVVLAEIAAVAGLAIALLVMAGLARWQLNRRRIAYWGSEWSAFGPRWTSRRGSGG